MDKLYSLLEDSAGYVVAAPGFYPPVIHAVPDYIFVIDPPGRQHSITGFLKPPRTQDLEPGLPRKGVCGSDHVSLCVGLIWEDSF